jgi:hypothetical protein
MFAAASFIGRHPVDVVKSPARRIPRRGHLYKISDMALSTAATEFARTLGVLGVTQHRAGQWFSVNARSIRRWRSGDRRVPAGVVIVCRLLAAKVVTAAQVEAVAAVPVPARTNGEPPAPLRAAPAPEEQPALAPRRARTAARADLGLTTAEKVVALAADTCRWPCGDPQHPDFHFCSAPTAKPPYCPRHRAVAFLAPRPGRGHGAHGFVTYGRHGRPSIPSAFSATGAARAPKVLFDRASDLPSSAPPLA